jgi:hypothetical protein
LTSLKHNKTRGYNNLPLFDDDNKTFETIARNSQDMLK